MRNPLKFSSTERDLLKAVYRFSLSNKEKVYLVGGVLRDILLGRRKENPDIDFAIKKGTINFARSLSKRMKCGFVVLDKEHGACRLVKKFNNRIYTLDFTDFRKKTLEGDLSHRDFTINAMALELSKAIGNRGLDNFIIDPYGGRADLEKKEIRAIIKTGFCEDPLRILRAFSFSAMLGFSIDNRTLKLAKRDKAKLSKVSFERIRDELFKIFDTPNTFLEFCRMDELRILRIIFPEIEKMRNLDQGPYHHLDVWKHTLETIRQLEIVFQEADKKKEIKEYLDENISSERKRRALMKLGALLHDIGKPDALRFEDGKIKFHGHERIGLEMTEMVGGRLKLSNDELYALKKIVLCHLRPGYLADNEEVTARAKFRYFRDTGNEAVSTLLLSIADQRATKGRLTTLASRKRHERVVFGLIEEYFRRKKEKKAPRLINGDDLIKKLKLNPSPLIGKILSEVEELQAIGKINTKKQALEAAKKYLAASLRKKKNKKR